MCSAVAVSILVYFLGGKNVTSDFYRVGRMRQRGTGEADQINYAKMLAESYDAAAATIYAITSGYSARGFDADAKKRMATVMAKLDECLRHGVDVVRFFVEPDSLPLAPDYVDWVCLQLQRQDRDGNPIRGDAKAYDARRLLNLPSMALIRYPDGSGVVRHVFESMEPQPGGPPDAHVRNSEMCWEVKYDRILIDALKSQLDGIARRHAPLTFSDFRRLFGVQPPMAAA
jgi:hypothetical protein